MLRLSTNEATGTPATDGVKEFGVTGDFTWDFGGASLFASAVWVNSDDPNVVTRQTPGASASRVATS